MVEEVNYKEDHWPMDIKLIFYALLNVIGIATSLYGYLFRPWEKVRLLVGLGSLFYLLLSGLWMFLSHFYLTPTTFRGNLLESSGKRKGAVWLKSECWLPEGVYRVKRVDAKSGNEGEVLGEGHVQLWVDDKGRLLSQKFCRDFMAVVVASLPSKSD